MQTGIIVISYSKSGNHSHPISQIIYTVRNMNTGI
jgi:hypothetical protein